MNPRFIIINPETDKRWDAYVMAHPLGTIYHHSAWLRVIEKTYHYQPFMVAVEDPDYGRLEGIAPFFRIDSGITGKRLVSLPFTSYCELLMPEGSLPGLIQFIEALHPDIDYILLKFLRFDGISCGTCDKDYSHVTHILDLKSSLDELHAAFHPTSVKQRIRRAVKNGLQFRISHEERDMERFYALETGVRKKHGLPPQPNDFFANMWRILKPLNHFMLVVVELGNQIVAAATVLIFKDAFFWNIAPPITAI